MTDAALRLVETFDQRQQAIACRAFPDDEERQLWFYTPTDHGGLDLGRMTPTQHQLVHRLVATGYSKAGYVTAATIMGLENILDLFDDWPGGRARERRRDPLLYYVTIFGEPRLKGAWAWRFGGHHISLHHLIIDGEVAASTPSFFGANPADSPLLGPHLNRPLAAIEDLGRELFRSFKDDKRSLALLSPEAPGDIISGNRSSLREGDRELIQAGSREALAAGMTYSMDEGLQFSLMPEGVSTDRLDHGEIDILRELIGHYLNRLPDALADKQAALVDTEFADIRFAWAGSAEPNEPHYYRIQGKRLFIEYDNTQNNANHIHAVWRDLANDFGGDVLARHYAEHQH
jgi:hypothetical protein